MACWGRFLLAKTSIVVINIYIQLEKKAKVIKQCTIFHPCSLQAKHFLPQPEARSTSDLYFVSQEHLITFKSAMMLSTFLIKTLFRYWLWHLWRVTALWFHSLPSVIDAENPSVAFPIPTSLWAWRPRSNLPYGTRKICARPDIRRPEIFIAVVWIIPSVVLTIHVPPGPPRAAGFRTFGPLSCDPLRHTERMDKLSSHLLFFRFVERHGFGDVECVLDLGLDGFTGGGQQLYGDRFTQLPEALNSLKRAGRSAVLQHRSKNGNILLHCGYWEVAV